jgi:hypothetical protein
MPPVTGSDSLVVVRHRNHTGHDDRALQRRAATGELTRLRSGAYVPTAVWRTLRAEDRRRLEAAAMAEQHAGYAASHRTAGALWRIPSLRRHDGIVDARVTAASGSRTEHGVRKHAVRDVDQHLTVIDGIRCTTIERTALDLAATEDFADAVVALDHVLKRVTRTRMREVLDEWAPVRGRRRIEAALDFADPRSGSAGESWSRVQIAEAGFVVPVLQQEFFDDAGLIGIVDFWWPGCNRIGEFDGLKKYKESKLLAGRSPGDVVSEEKIREDRLRASRTQPGVSRWIWETLLARGALSRQLAAAGVPHR